MLLKSSRSPSSNRAGKHDELVKYVQMTRKTLREPIWFACVDVSRLLEGVMSSRLHKLSTIVIVKTVRSTSEPT